ncbi:unnamed protein product [Owenia fusiformis]|uniref:protein-tyrosine-phosphatase n=1 Tax=Owenia fusiformis TaxID=6347 RepID=A0A8S4MXP0_OWEFU|nr:unnamed protein product [Owenia fusiformis]
MKSRWKVVLLCHLVLVIKSIDGGYVNMAQGRSPEQSSSYYQFDTSYNKIESAYNAFRANDLNVATCSQTNADDGPYWRVPLDGSHQINNIEITTQAKDPLFDAQNGTCTGPTINDLTTNGQFDFSTCLEGCRGRDDCKGFQIAMEPASDGIKGCYAFSSMNCGTTAQPDSKGRGNRYTYFKQASSSSVEYKIYVGSDQDYNQNALCRTETLPNKETRVVQCDSNLEGNWVIIRRGGGSKTILSLCEVKINVCEKGYFGSTCASRCHCKDSSEHCDKWTGVCTSGCAAGWKGTGCDQACDAGTFGSGCDKTCHCKNNDVCDKATGECSNGCGAGWTDDADNGPCQRACSSGYWGDNCEQRCDDGCSGGTCDRFDGSCGCADYYLGALCDIYLPVMTKPPVLAEGSVTSDSISVTFNQWTSGVDAGDADKVTIKHYIVQYCDVPRVGDICTDGPKVDHIREGNTNTTVVTGLATNKAYAFRVVIYSEYKGQLYQGRPGPRGAEGTTLCGAPTEGCNITDSVSASESPKTSVKLTWTYPPMDTWGCNSLTKVEILYKREEDTVWSAMQMEDTKTPEYTIPALDFFTTYVFKIRITNDDDYSVNSSVGELRTQEGVPSAPRNLKRLSHGSDYIRLEYEEPLEKNGIITNYTAKCEDQSSDFQRSSTVDSSTLEIRVDNLESESNYSCFVSASTSIGPGPASNPITQKTMKKPPPAIPKDDMKVKVGDGNKESMNGMVDITFKEGAMYTQGIDQPDLIRFIVVKIPNRRKKRSSEEMYDTALTYEQAKAQNIDQYVAADVLPSMIAEKNEFTIGDNRNYNGFNNRHLDPGETYEFHIGTMYKDGENVIGNYTNAGRASVSTEAKIQSSHQATEDALGAAIVGIVIAAVVVLIVILLLVYFLVERKRKERNTKNVKTLNVHQRDSMHGANRHASIEMPEMHETQESRTNGRLTAHDANGKHNSAMSGIDNPTFVKEDVSRQPSNRSGISNKSGVSVTSVGSDASAIRRENHDIPVEELWEYIKHKKENKAELFEKEYNSIPFDLTEPTEVASRDVNKNKNRFINIIAYDHSRVILEQEDDDPDSDYVNASYIKGYEGNTGYIASQGPNKYTAIDMWRLVWQENCNRIVMVTNLVENGKKKCEQYWPDDGSLEYGEFTVELAETQQLSDFIIRTFAISKRGGTARHVHHFLFTSWPDHGVPNATSLLGLRRKVNSYAEHNKGRLLVHCSAGVGRTGSYITVDKCIHTAKRTGIVNVYDTVLNMRADRVKMVQTLEQYIFVHDALVEALICGETNIPCSEFQETYQQLCEIDATTGKSQLQRQYEILNQMRTEVEPEKISNATEPRNKEKNRDMSVLPANLYRPYLITMVDGGTDYINAVYLDGYKQKNAYIITQHPMPHTVTDFWRLIHDHHVHSIVMLNELTYDSEENLDESSSELMVDSPPDNAYINHVNCAKYWPDDEQTYEIFQVKLLNEDSTNANVTERQFKLSCSKRVDEEPRDIKQFDFQCWPNDKSLPTSNMSLLGLFDDVEKWQQKTQNGPIVIHCVNGSQFSGVYAALNCIREKMKIEQEIDIFQTVKHMRNHRPEIITDVEQYKFLYDMSQFYMESFSTYANFSI